MIQLIQKWFLRRLTSWSWPPFLTSTISYSAWLIAFFLSLFFSYFRIFLDYLLELIALLLSNTYQVQNKLILTNVVDWLLESNILHVEYPACIKLINTFFENTTDINFYVVILFTCRCYFFFFILKRAVINVNTILTTTKKMTTPGGCQF